jgi:DNA-binding NarL/FixJ family response regulator
MVVCAQAKTGVEAVDMARRFQPDLVTLDLSMPDMDGFEAAVALHKVSPRSKVLILTVHEDTDTMTTLLQRGVSGYMIKNAAGDDLAYAIRRIASGGTYIDPNLANKIVNASTSTPFSATVTHEIPLSRREEQVLRLTALGYTNSEIAAQLHLSIRTVETYKSRMLDKLGLKSRVEVVSYAIRRGWMRDL